MTFSVDEMAKQLLNLFGKGEAHARASLYSSTASSRDSRTFWTNVRKVLEFAALLAPTPTKPKSKPPLTIDDLGLE